MICAQLIATTNSPYGTFSVGDTLELNGLQMNLACEAFKIRWYNFFPRQEIDAKTIGIVNQKIVAAKVKAAAHLPEWLIYSSPSYINAVNGIICLPGISTTIPVASTKLNQEISKPSLLNQGRIDNHYITRSAEIY